MQTLRRLTLGTGVVLMLALAQTPAHAVDATGGAITTTNGYRIHTFTNAGSSTLTVNAGGDVEVLVVAGGGGGGRFGGGGGAGGLVYSNAFAVTASNYTVIVGDGGAGSTVDHVVGANGSNSVFGALTAYGGGGGGSRLQSSPYTGQNGGGGGSGGGGSPSDAAPQGIGGSPTNGQGNAGSNGGGYGWGGGGGGGAGSPGSNTTIAGRAGSYDNAGQGGDGRAYAITGSNAWYAGGGGGGTYVDGTGNGAAGGRGGGGAGQRNAVGTAGTPNTGGGGGAGAHSSSAALNGGKGGSGIVIVKYLMNTDIPQVDNGSGATNIVSTSASLVGNVTSTGTAPTSV